MNNRFTLATLPRTTRGQPLVIASSPDGKNLLYAHGHSVIIRELDAPQCSDVYTQHATDVLVAKYSPSGFYIASADKSGKVRIWDTVNKEHILKNEYQPISGPIKDLAWSGDNQRMVVVGEGREKFGHVFLADTGTSNGDISGQTRPVNSCDFKPSRPFRIVCGSEDNTAAFYEGPPFKFKGTKNEHSRYVQVVRYSPDGKFWASAGFDGKVFIYDGATSELIGEFKDEAAKGNAHAGGVYGLAWSPNGQEILTASGDKSCKIWTVESRTVRATIKIGEDVDSQQLGCCWAKNNHLVSVSLSGKLNFIDAETGTLSKTVDGHNKPITAMAQAAGGKKLYTASSDGRLQVWDTEQGSCSEIVGGPTVQVNDIFVSGEGAVFVASIDDTLRKVADDKYVEGFSVKLDAQPHRLTCLDDGGVVVVTLNSAVIVDGASGSVKSKIPLSYEASAVASNPSNGHVAIGEGGNNQQSVRIYEKASISGGELKEIKLSGSITDLKYSPDGKYLVATDSNRKVTLFNVGNDYAKAHEKEWGFHTAKVTCAAWSPDGRFVATGGLDTAIIIWSVAHPAKHHIATTSHVQSQITRVAWLDNSTLVSSGQDGNVKIWNVSWDPAK